MAASASTTFNHLLFFFLLLSSVQIEARVNKFFSKFIHTDHQIVPNNLSPAPVSSPPEISPSLAPTPFLDESQNAYGLYGRDSDADENTRTITDVEEEILAGDGEDEANHKSGFTMNNFVETNNYDAQYQNNKYENNNGFRNSEYDNNNEYRNSEYENNKGGNYEYQSNFEEDEATRQQGMSDTRFMENGRYFHDIKSRNGEEKEWYGSKKYPKYEFDSMEEYERSEGLLP